MPELPEVETIKNDLIPHVVGKTITNVTFPPDPKIRILRRFPSQNKFITELQGTKIKSLRRRAKYLIFDIQPSRTLIMHLGMSGQLLIRKAGVPQNLIFKLYSTLKMLPKFVLLIRENSENCFLNYLPQKTFL